MDCPLPHQKFDPRFQARTRLSSCLAVVIGACCFTMIGCGSLFHRFPRDLKIEAAVGGGSLPARGVTIDLDPLGGYFESSLIDSGGMKALSHASFPVTSSKLGALWKEMNNVGFFSLPSQQCPDALGPSLAITVVANRRQHRVELHGTGRYPPVEGILRQINDLAPAEARLVYVGQGPCEALSPADTLGVGPHH